jgi:predicted DNA-binding transcriptional regulator YafY
LRLDPLVRYLKMHKMLSRPTGATIPDLMEETGASRPTVYRLLKAIEATGDALDKDKLPSRQVRYRIDDPFLKRDKNNHSFRIARDELIAIQFVRRYARLFKGTELQEDIDNVFRKIEGTIDPKHYRMLKRADRLFLPNLKGAKDYTAGKVAETIDTLSNAILLERRCRTRYHSFSSETVRNLKLDPLHFFEHNGGLYLFARAERREDVRMYAVERFLKVEMTEEKYDYPEGFDPARRLESTFSIFDEEKATTFRIRFSKRQAKYIAERRWAAKQKIGKQPDGSIILTMTTMGHQDVIRWVLGHGPEAELLEPEPIRREIEALLADTVDNYRRRGRS